MVDGERTFTASVKDYEDAEGVENSKKYTIEALGHDYEILKKTIEYCSAQCRRCNEKVGTVHDEDEIEWTPIEGNKHVKKCEICGEVIATENCNSTFIKTEKVATCTEAGESSYFDCSVCHRHASEDHTVPALGHEYVYDETAAEEGIEQHKCTRCGEVEACAYDESIEQGNDENHENHIVKGTCKTCKHETVLRNEAHEYDEEIVQKAGDSEYHKVEGTCTKCGYKTDLRDEAHNYEYKLSPDQKQHYKQCKDCGYIDESSKEDHDYEYTQLEKVGAYDQHKKVCKTCGKEVKRETCVFNQTIIVTGEAATCEEDGVVGYSYKACVCGRAQEEVQPKVLPASGHNLTVENVDGGYKVTCSNLVRPNGSSEKCIEYGKPVTVESLSEIFGKKLNEVKINSGNIEITEDLVIPEGITLEVENGGNLIIDNLSSINDIEKVTITNKGTVTVHVSSQKEILDALDWFEGKIKLILEGNLELNDTVLNELEKRTKENEVTVSASDGEETKIKQHVSTETNLAEAIKDGYADEIILDRKVTINEELEIKNSLKLNANQSTLKDLKISADNVEISNANIKGKLTIEGENAVIENTTVTVTDASNVITISKVAEGAILKNVTAENDGSQGTALDIECDNVTIEGGSFTMKNESLQGQGAIRIGAESMSTSSTSEIKHLNITGATLSGGIHVLGYGGDLKDLVIKDNTITLASSPEGAKFGCIIITNLKEKNKDTLTEFAQTMSKNNTFNITNQNVDSQILIQTTSSDPWTTLVEVKANGTVASDNQ